MQSESGSTIEYEQSVLIESRVRQIPNRMLQHNPSFQPVYIFCFLVTLLAVILFPFLKWYS